jgi:hypothetical protein
MTDRLIDRAAARLGRALHRLIHPQYLEEQARLDHIAAAQRKEVRALRTEVGGIAEQVGKLALDRDVRRLEHHVEALRDGAARQAEASARQYKVMAQALKRAEWDEELRVDERRIVHRLARLKKSNQPVLVGPWTGEVGFELLYWIPFVTWALARAGVSPERVFIVSRGGPASWYAHLGGRYVDTLSHVTPDQFRAATEAVKKQRTMGRFDRDVVRFAMRHFELQRPFLLHPGLMYRLFNPFWKQQVTVRRVENYATYGKVAGPTLPALAGRLPADYVAVRFYFSDCFPDTPENRLFVESTVRSITDEHDVVMLNTGFSVDDHRDYSPARAARIHTVDDLMVPERNLDVQTAVIAGARAFVGTYGGYSYLAPLLGVPSLAFYSVRDSFFAHHLELAERVFRQLNAGSLVPLDVRDARLVRMALGSAAAIRS